MKKTYKKSVVLAGAALVAFGCALVFMILGLTSAVDEVHEDVVSRTPDALLASAGLENGKPVSLPVTYYDQKADMCVNVYDVGSRDALLQRQFEWTKCEYYNKDVEQGLVDYYLDENYLPVALGGGDLTTNKGVRNENFARWFSAVDGVNIQHPGLIQLDYDEGNASFSFHKREFYPLDSFKDDLTDETFDGHNHLFTMELVMPFTVLANGSEQLEIAADDDTWVYVGDTLVIDMGGVHGVTGGGFMINELGEVYAAAQDEELAYTGVVLEAGEGAMIRIFHADRDSDSSEFNLDVRGMNLAVEDSRFSKRGEDNEGAMQIAYDPNMPTYEAPLGVTSVVKPSAVGEHIMAITIEGVLVVVFSLAIMVSLRFIVRVRRNSGNQ